MGLDNFSRDPKWVGARLGIDRAIASLALERLIRLGFLEEKNGQLIRSSPNSFTTDGVASSAVRNFHSQIIKKAENSIEEQSVLERSLSCLYVALNEDQVLELSQLIKEFTQSLDEQVTGENQKKDRLYCLSTQFFRLDRKNDSFQ